MLPRLKGRGASGHFHFCLSGGCLLSLLALWDGFLDLQNDAETKGILK